MAISILKIRRPLGRLIFNMGIAIPGKTVFLIETAPWASTAMLLTYFARNTLVSISEGLTCALGKGHVAVFQIYSLHFSDEFLKYIYSKQLLKKWWWDVGGWLKFLSLRRVVKQKRINIFGVLRWDRCMWTLFTALPQAHAILQNAVIILFVSEKNEAFG